MRYNEEDNSEEDNKKIKKWVISGIIAGFLILIILSSLVLVPAGSVKVITRFGAINRVAEQGISLKIPLVEGAHSMSIRTQKDQVEASAASFNLQTVSSEIAVNYHLNPFYAATVFAEVGRNYQELVIAPAIQDAFKAVTARYTAEQLIQKRDEVSIKAEEELQAQIEKYHIVVESFNIVNFDFSPEYNKAIEEKQVAEQNVATSKLILQKAQVEAQIKVTEAEGQANAQAALKKTGALTTEYLQYLFLTRWNGILPEVMGGTTPVFDINNFLTEKTK